MHTQAHKCPPTYAHACMHIHMPTYIHTIELECDNILYSVNPWLF